MPPVHRKKLRDLIATTHEQGRMLRFWATPDTSAVWGILAKEGVDLIGADDLSALSRYLRLR